MGNSNKRPKNTVAIQIWENFLEESSKASTLNVDSKAIKLTLGLVQEVLIAVDDSAESFGLNLSDGGVGDAAVHILINSIHKASPSSVTTLSLRNCGLTPSIAKSFCHGLAQLPHLLKLDLSANALGPVAVKMLLSELRLSAALANLDISDCEANDMNCDDLAEFAKFCTGISYLDVSSNSITDKGAKVLCQILDDLPRIAILCLYDNSISDDVMAIIDSKAERNRQIAVIFDDILSQLRFYKFEKRKTKPAARKRKREHPHWTTEVPLLSESLFNRQFPVQKSKKSKSDAPEENIDAMKVKSEDSDTSLSNTASEHDKPAMQSPKSKQELEMKQDASKEESMYPRAQLPRIVPSARFNVGHFDSIGKRPMMEDAMLLNGRFRGSQFEDLYAVFDGHGGPHAAAYVAAAFPNIFAELLAHYPGDIEKCLVQSYQFLDAEVKTWARYLGCTAVIAYITHDTLYVSNVGDSRAVLSRDGIAHRLSFDHKPDDVAETLRIEALGGTVVDGRVRGRLGVARAFGDSFLHMLVPADPHLTSYKLSPDDHYLILACDGVFDVYQDQDLVDAVERMIKKDGIMDPQRWAKSIVKKSLERGSEDNISAIVIALNDSKIRTVPVSSKVTRKRAKLSPSPPLGALVSRERGVRKSEDRPRPEIKILRTGAQSVDLNAAQNSDALRKDSNKDSQKDRETNKEKDRSKDTVPEVVQEPEKAKDHSSPRGNKK